MKDSELDVEVPQSFFSEEDLNRLMEETKPQWVPASEFFVPHEALEGDAKAPVPGKIGRGGLFVEETVTGARLRRLSNGEWRGCSKRSCAADGGLRDCTAGSVSLQHSFVRFWQGPSPYQALSRGALRFFLYHGRMIRV